MSPPLVIRDLLDDVLRDDDIEAARPERAEVNQIHLEVDEARIARVAGITAAPLVDPQRVPAPCLKMLPKDTPAIRSHVEEPLAWTGLEDLGANTKQTTVTLQGVAAGAYADGRPAWSRNSVDPHTGHGSMPAV